MFGLFLYGFFFVQNFFSRTTREFEYLCFLSCKAQFFFQNLTLGYMTKTLNQIYFFPSPKSEYFFSNIGNQNILFRKKPCSHYKRLNVSSLHNYHAIISQLIHSSFISIRQSNFIFFIFFNTRVYRGIQKKSVKKIMTISFFTNQISKELHLLSTFCLLQLVHFQIFANTVKSVFLFLSYTIALQTVKYALKGTSI